MKWEGLEFIRVPANGISFEVATMGAGDRLALCLHGFPEHAISWRHQMPLLAKLGYRVWAPNLRGYGATDSPQEISAYRTKTLVEDVAALIQAANAKEILLIAHDWGGALAWILAMRRPELIHRLAILNVPHPACFARELHRFHQLRKSWYMFFFQIPALPEYLLGRDHARMIGRMFRNGARSRSRFPDDVIDVYRDNASRPGGLTAMLNWYRAFFQGRKSGQGSAAGGFPKITTPTLFPLGRRRHRPRLSHHPRHRKLRLRSYFPRPARHLPLGSTRSPRSRQRHARSLAHRCPRPRISRARRFWSLALRGRIFTPPPFSANRR
jgi:pimeloyl-ACP methyl ester carboxylesterase